MALDSLTNFASYSNLCLQHRPTETVAAAVDSRLTYSFRSAMLITYLDTQPKSQYLVSHTIRADDPFLLCLFSRVLKSMCLGLSHRHKDVQPIRTQPIKP